MNDHNEKLVHTQNLIPPTKPIPLLPMMLLLMLNLVTPLVTALIPLSLNGNSNRYLFHRPQQVTHPAPIKSHSETTTDPTTSKNDVIGNSTNEINRRKMFGDILRFTATTTTYGCTFLGCSCSAPSYALTTLVPPNPTSESQYDVFRNPLIDANFARGMATGMVDYEREAFPKKKQLFLDLFRALEEMKAKREKDDGPPTVVEIGMGSFPNALYYSKAVKQMGGLDVIGIDPNDRMEEYARDSAKRAGIVDDAGDAAPSTATSLRIVHGVGEALPLASASVDAVVCTLTLCSVLNPEQSLSEIKRVLKPGGKFLFWEHVLSETDNALKKTQIEMTPQQMKRADGCHLDRRTGKMIEAAGFQELDMEYLELRNFYVLKPTVCGIATA